MVAPVELGSKFIPNIVNDLTPSHMVIARFLKRQQYCDHVFLQNLRCRCIYKKTSGYLFIKVGHKLHQTLHRITVHHQTVELVKYHFSTQPEPRHSQ